MSVRQIAGSMSMIIHFMLLPMRHLSFLLVAVILLAASCDPEPAAEQTGQVDLNFKATYQGTPLVMFDEIYTYPDGSAIKFKLFNYYISDITLIADGPGEDQLISEVELIDYAEVYDVTTAAEGITINIDNVKPGIYTGIRIGLGLSGELNATQPGDYAAGHPLTDNFWSWSLGYVFTKIEANADLDGDGEFSDKITYHVGADELFTVVEFSNPMAIEPFDPMKLNFSVDLYDVLYNGGNFIDLNEESNTRDHTNDEAIYGFIWQNLVNAVNINN